MKKIVYWFEDEWERINIHNKLMNSYLIDKEPPFNFKEHLDSLGWDLEVYTPDMWDRAKDIKCEGASILWVIDLHVENEALTPEMESWAKAQLKPVEDHLNDKFGGGKYRFRYPEGYGLAVASLGVRKSVPMIIASHWGSAPWRDEAYRFLFGDYWETNLWYIQGNIPEAIPYIKEKIRWMDGCRGLAGLSLGGWIKVKSIGHKLRDRIGNRNDIDDSLRKFLMANFHSRHMDGGCQETYKKGSDAWEFCKSIIQRPDLILTKEGMEALKKCGYDPSVHGQGHVEDWSHPPFRALIDERSDNSRQAKQCNDFRDLIRCWEDWETKGDSRLDMQVDTNNIDARHNFLWFNISRVLSGISGLVEATANKDRDGQIAVSFKSVKDPYYDGLLAQIDIKTDSCELQQYNKWVPYANEEAQAGDFYKNFVSSVLEGGVLWIFYGVNSGQEIKGHFVYRIGLKHPYRKEDTVHIARHTTSGAASNVTLLCFCPSIEKNSIYKKGSQQIIAFDDKAKFYKNGSLNIVMSLL